MYREPSRKYMTSNRTQSHRSFRLVIVFAFGVAFAAVAMMGVIAYQELRDLRTLAIDVAGPNEYRDDLEGLHDSWAKADHSVRSYVLTWEGRDLTPYLQHLFTYDSLKAQFLRESKAFQETYKKELGEDKFGEDLEPATQSLIRLMETRLEIHEKIIQQINNYEVLHILKQTNTLDTIPRKDDFDNWLKKLIAADGRKYLKPAQASISDTSNTDWTSEDLVARLPSLDNQYEEIRSLYRQDAPLHMEMYRQIARLRGFNQKIRRVSSETVRDEAKEGNVMIGVLAALVLVVLGLFLARIFSDLERNAQLEKELEAQKNLAETLAEAKEEFLANMSHEMRTPLGAIIGYGDQLAKTTMSPHQQKLLRPIQHAADLLLALINDILDFSKLESGNFSLERIPFNPREVVNEVIDIFALKATEKGITLSQQVHPQVPEAVLGDRTRLKQMLLNLVSNGIKFTPQGYVKITVNPVPGQSDMLLLSVEDTGIGIRKEKQAFIFEEFMQEDNSTSRKFGGTGLGLAITKKLTELQGGTVQLQSEPGKGTRVTLKLPLAKTSGQTFMREEGEKILPTSELKGKRVLLADDVEANRELVGYILREWGFEVDPVADGAIAYKYINQKTYDLILLDVHMPEIDGLEVARRIRAEIGDDLPVVAVTATSSPQKIKEFMAFGFDGVLLKPFKETQLWEEVNRVMRLKAGNGETSTQDLPQSPDMESFNQLRQMSGGDQQMVKHMLKQYMDTSEPQLAALKQEVDAKNWPQVAIKAHRLVPSARILELDDIVTFAKQIENAADSKQGVEQIPAWFDKLAKAITVARAKVAASIAQIDKD